MDIIHTTRVYTHEELSEGIEFDFPSNAEKLKGVQVIEEGNNAPLYHNATIELKVDRGVYLPRETQVSMLQADITTAPNQRFFTLAGKIDTPSKKCFITVNQSTEYSLIFVLLLED
ncbi:MAG: hypothetical protein JXR68_14175 [Bacteroidales bacterium]|nr:hypothetical protein [Bacteroidales bacterium]